MNKINRVELLDEIRGFFILCVVAYHATYDLLYIYHLDISSPALSLIMQIIQPLGSGALIFVSGIVSRYSKSNIKRGLITLGLSFLISIISMIAAPGNEVRFGVLSLLGSSMLIYGILEKLSLRFKKLKSIDLLTNVLLVINAILFIFTYNIKDRFLGFFRYPLIQLPESLYKIYFLYPLGLPTTDFASSDYFPLMPFLFLFMAGAFLGAYFKENRMPAFFYRGYCKPLSWLGRHSLWIYLLHQPILIGIFTLIF